MRTIIIASMDRNGVIGRTSKACNDCCTEPDCSTCEVPCTDCFQCNGTGRIPANDIPWSYPEIDAHFDRETAGHAVILGRRTWEARGGRTLKGHTCMTVSSARGCVKSIDNAIALSRAKGLECAYIAGGARLFAATLPLADELDLTLIDVGHDGDIFFPGSSAWSSQKRVQLGDHTFEMFEYLRGETYGLAFTKWRRA